MPLIFHPLSFYVMSSSVTFRVRGSYLHALLAKVGDMEQRHICPACSASGSLKIQIQNFQ